MSAKDLLGSIGHDRVGLDSFEVLRLEMGCFQDQENIPFWLVFCKDLSLCVVADDFNIDKAAQIELLRPEHRHDGDFVSIERRIRR